MNRPPSFNLADLLQIVGDTVPERTALVCDGQRRSFRHLLDRSQALARWLQQRGIVAGDTVGVHAYNCIEYIEATIAAFLLRAIPANVNYRYTAEESRYLYANAELKALVYGGDLESTVTAALDAAPALRAMLRVGPGRDLMSAVGFEQAVAEGGPPLGDIARSGEDIMLLYTGGTTGMPKGVLWPHEALFYTGFGGGGNFSPKGPIRTIGELAERVRENFSMVHLPCGPLMHGAGMWGTLIGLLAGHTVHLNGRSDFNAEYILDKISSERISCVTIVGDAMALPLLDSLRAEPQRWDLSCVVAFSSAGALFSDHVRDGLKAFLPASVIISNGLGSSESGQVGTGSQQAGEGLIRLPPNPAVAVLVDDKRLARPGEQGVLVRFGRLPLGYFKDPEKSAATFREIDGRRCVVTGDIARYEADGSITVFGRNSQCINSGGEKVFTEEVEEVVRAQPGVYDALVVGLPDPRWGQKVVAVLSLRAGAVEDAEALKAHCRQHLAGYKVPKHFVFVPEVMRNAVGKADYPWARSTAEKVLVAG